MIEISIIIPIYKVEKYLERCLKSITSQTFRNFECILIDDGSPDKSPFICDEYCRKDSRFKVIHQENKGVSAARNTGILQASGEYLCFIDADDYIADNMLEELWRHHIQNGLDVDVVITNIKKVLDDRIIDIKYSFPDGVYDRDFLLDKMLYPDNIEGFVFIKLFKRSIIISNNILFDSNIKYMEDTLFSYSFLRNCKSGYVCSNQYYYYTINPDSITSAKYLPDGTFKVFECLLLLEENDSRRKLIEEKKNTFTAIQYIKSRCKKKNYVLPIDFPTKIESNKALRQFLLNKKYSLDKRLYYCVIFLFPFLYNILRRARGYK